MYAANRRRFAWRRKYTDRRTRCKPCHARFSRTRDFDILHHPLCCRDDPPAHTCNGIRLTHLNAAPGLDASIGRLSSLSDASGLLEGYSYLGLGTVIARARGNGVGLSYIGPAPGDAGDPYTGLDRYGRVVDHNWTDDTASRDRFTYTYDRNSNRTSKGNALNGSLGELYAYDPLNRLIDMQRGQLNAAKDAIVGPTVRSQTWSLDALGNSNAVNTDGVSEARSHNAQNQLTQMGTSPLASDANGSVTTDQTGKTFIYDAWNRLVEAKDGPATLIRYAHDALGRRIGENGVALYYSSQWQVVEEREGGIAVVQRTWSPVYVDSAIVIDRDSDADGTLDERSYVHEDANFNVTALTNAAGDVIERYLYDAYGRRTVLDANRALDADGLSDVMNRQGHQGGLIDRAIDYHVNFRNRILDVDAMRWTQLDPWGYVDGANLFVAMKNRPLSLRDPQGLSAEGDNRPPTTRPAVSDHPAKVDLDRLLQQAEAWNLGSPRWSVGNQCFDQATALMDHLSRAGSKHWDVSTIGGWNGVPKVGYHHATLLIPRPGNPLPAMVFDPFKPALSDRTTVSVCRASEFRAEFPYDCGCCRSHYIPVVSKWSIVMELLMIWAGTARPVGGP